MILIVIQFSLVLLELNDGKVDQIHVFSFQVLSNSEKYFSNYLENMY